MPVREWKCVGDCRACVAKQGAVVAKSIDKSRLRCTVNRSWLCLQSKYRKVSIICIIAVEVLGSLSIVMHCFRYSDVTPGAAVARGQVPS